MLTHLLYNDTCLIRELILGFKVYDCDGTCVTCYYGVQSLQHIPHLLFHFVLWKRTYRPVSLTSHMIKSLNVLYTNTLSLT